jgi:hypothetical protein
MILQCARHRKLEGREGLVLVRLFDRPRLKSMLVDDRVRADGFRITGVGNEKIRDDSRHRDTSGGQMRKQLWIFGSVLDSISLPHTTPEKATGGAPSGQKSTMCASQTCRRVGPSGDRRLNPSGRAVTSPALGSVSEGAPRAAVGSCGCWAVRYAPCLGFRRNRPSLVRLRPEDSGEAELARAFWMCPTMRRHIDRVVVRPRRCQCGLRSIDEGLRALPGQPLLSGRL